MEPVVTVNLGGNAYQLDQSAYEALRTYLDRAGAALGDNPDRAEIIRDLERAIAEKCAAYLSAHKSVISAAEIGAVLEQMGPVEGDTTTETRSDSGAHFAGEPRKRLFRVYDRHSITGVSAGLAAYAAVDPGIIRFLWIIATVFTSGLAAIGYIVLMFVMPPASSPEQVAAAHGAPFNAQDIIDRAKREYANFEAGPAQRWREAWRERGPAWRWEPTPVATPPRGPLDYLTRILAGIVTVVLGLASAALTIAFIVVLFSLITTGAVLGHPLPAGVPFWVGIIVVSIAYSALVAPLSMLQQSSQAAVTGTPRYQNHGAGWAVVAVVLVLLWVFASDPGDAQEWARQGIETMRHWVEQIDRSF